MNWWQKAIGFFSCAGLAFGLMAFAHQSEAEACTGSPPPPDCGVAINPSLAIDETYLNDENQSIDAEMTAAVFLTVTGSDWRCRSMGATAEIDLTATCQEVDTEEIVESGTLGYAEDIEQGMNRIPLTMSVDPGLARHCTIDGEVIATLDSGQTATTEMADQSLCTTTPSPDDPSRPAIDLTLDAGEDGVITARPGDPKLLPYEVTNNTDEQFQGVFRATSANTESEIDTGEAPPPDPNPDEVCDPDWEPPSSDDGDDDDDGCPQVYEPECGCDMQVYNNSCEREKAGVQFLDDGDCPERPPSASGFAISMEGEGDSFPVIFKEDAPDDACIPMPENPAEHDDVQIYKQIDIGPGETEVVNVIKRAWDLCADGSCSRTSASIAGQFESGGDVAACGGASFIVMEDADPSDADGDDSTGACQDTGETPDTGTWNDPDEPSYEVPDDFEDSSGNGVYDIIEEAYGYDPNDPNEPSDPSEYSWDALLDQDTTDNGVPDLIEILYGYDPTVDDIDNPEDYSDEALMNKDSSGNGVSDYEEIYIYGADPHDPDSPQFYEPYWTIDTSGNGVSDFIEIAFGYDPLDSDTPADPDQYSWESLLDSDYNDNGVPDAVELAFGYDPQDPDTPADPDNYTEEELQNRDSDGDGLTDYEEIYEVYLVYDYPTDPLDPDTDGDDYGDGEEFNHMGTDPLDPYDPDSSNWSNTPKAGVIFQGSTDDVTTRVVGSGTLMEDGVDVERTTATATQLTSQIGRIYETVELEEDAISPGEEVELTIPFDVMPHFETSPYQIDDLQLGVKPQDSDFDGSYLTGAGKIQLDSSPYTIFEFMYRVTLWVENPETGALESLIVDDEDFVIDEDAFEVHITMQAPDFEFDEIDLTHDMNAHEREAYKEICDDGQDTNNNGLVDCDDPYCFDDPACTDEPGPGPDSCSSDADCAVGEVCFGGTCHGESEFDTCSSSADCGAGESCISGQCFDDDELSTCSSDADCGSGDACVSGQCVPESFIDCSTDSDCADGELCTDSTCVAEDDLDTCDTVDDCGSGETCDGGFCVPSDDLDECTADAECDGGRICVGGLCRDETDVVDCTTDFDCAATGEVCEDGYCVDEDVAGDYDSDDDGVDEDSRVERTCTTTGNGAPVTGMALLLVLGLAWANRRRLKQAVVPVENRR